MEILSIGGATRIIWPFAWVEPKENYISFGWNILRNSEGFLLKYEDIIEIKKIHSVFLRPIRSFIMINPYLNFY